MLREIIVTPETLGPAVDRLFADVVERSRVLAIHALQRAAYAFMAEAVRQIGEVKPYQPVDTGELRRGYRVTLQPDGASVENIAPHAAFMEFGTRPHWAPLAALEAWAERKLRGQIRNRAARQSPARTFARAVQRKIAKHGTAARGFHAAASQKLPEIVERELRAALAKVGA